MKTIFKGLSSKSDSTCRTLHFATPVWVGRQKISCSKKPTSSIEFLYEIFNNSGEKTTEGKTLLAFLNSDSMKPIRCPDMISKLF